MGRLRLAVIGWGRVGKACAEGIMASEDLALAGIVRRPESLGQTLPEPFRALPVAGHISELQEPQGALLCIPAEQVEGVAHDLLQHRISVVDCASLHGEQFSTHKREMGRMALRHRAAAIVGAGWDPGALSVFRTLFALLVPKGGMEAYAHTGVSLHHTLTARAVAGVKDALCTELRTAAGAMQRYVYVELAAGAEGERVAAAIRAEPLFLDEETLVFPVESVAALEEEGRGVVLERRGTAGRTGHQRFLLEARYDEPALTAQVMLAAARALPTCRPGAHSLLDLPLGALWGIARERAEALWT